MQDALNSASSVTQMISGELAEGQRNLLALAAAGANSKAGNPLVPQLSNGPLAGLHDKVGSFTFTSCLRTNFLCFSMIFVLWCLILLIMVIIHGFVVFFSSVLGKMTRI